MKKKQYLKPRLDVVVMDYQPQILAGSVSVTVKGRNQDTYGEAEEW